jgi:outer membrane lipoprotein
MNSRHLLPFALATALCACATTSPSQQYARLDPEQASANERVGDVVRWGGRIVEVRTEKLYTCFEIVGAPLDAAGRPRRVDRSTGRFIACRNGFYEPQVFERGRELTVTGRIESFETRKVGDYDYRYPRVAADDVHLWNRRQPMDDPWLYDRPFFGFGFGYRGWYDPWYRW